MWDYLVFVFGDASTEAEVRPARRGSEARHKISSETRAHSTISTMAIAGDSKLKSAEIMNLMATHLESDAGKELTKRIGFVYQINIAPKKIGFNEEHFVVDLKNGKVSAGKCEGKPDAAFSFTDDDFLALSRGKLSPQMAFIRGKMKISGSMSAANKFTPDIFPKPAKM